MKTVFGAPLSAYTAPFVLLIAAVLYVGTAYTYRPAAAAFPLAVGWATIILLILDLISRSKTNLGEGVNLWLNGATSAEMAQKDKPAPPVRRQAAAIFCVAAFVAAMILIGILYAVPPYVFFSMWLFGGKSLKVSAISAIGITLFVYLMFVAFLRVELYPGVLFGG
jgi:hypothetical protein